MKLSEFFAGRKTVDFKKGQVIIEPGEDPSGVYFIVDGFVKLYSETENGEEKLQIFYKSSEIFPLIWAVTGLHRDVYYEAISDVRLKKALKKDLLELVKKDSEASFDLNQVLTVHFNIFADRVENLEITKAYPRLVYRLISLAKRFGRESGKEIVLDIPITHKDIANSINMSRETASREFEALEKRNLVHYSSHKIVLTDLEKLKKELVAQYESQPL